jgi:hypothetical protein
MTEEDVRILRDAELKRNIYYFILRKMCPVGYSGNPENRKELRSSLDGIFNATDEILPHKLKIAFGGEE